MNTDEYRIPILRPLPLSGSYLCNLLFSCPKGTHIITPSGHDLRSHHLRAPALRVVKKQTSPPCLTALRAASICAPALKTTG